MIRHLLTLIWNRKKRNALLLIELAFSFIILFGVLSFIIYNMDRYTSPLGFETKNIWVVHCAPPYDSDSAQIVDTRIRLKQHLEELPEIAAVSVSSNITPFSGSTSHSVTDDNGYELSCLNAEGDEDFARTLGLNLIEGRWFKEEDRLKKNPPIVITKMTRDAYWKDTAVIGKVIQWNGTKEIVGVVEHYKYRGEFEEEMNLIFEDFPPSRYEGLSFLLKLNDGVTADFEQKLNTNINLTAKGWRFFVDDLEATRKRTSRGDWIPIVAMLSICAFLIINVALGLFGVLVYTIKKRRSEIGIRRAVGASPAGIAYQLTIEMLLITGMSIIIGVFFAVQFPLLNVFDMEMSIYVRAVVFSILIIYLLVIVCTLYPGRQASLIHPATALHEE